MGMDVLLGYDVFDTVVADVGDAIGTLAASRRRAGDDVARLLDGGWSGDAADAFAVAWQEWCAGADQVQAALTSIAAALGTTRRELTTVDDVAAAESHDLLGRLG